MRLRRKLRLQWRQAVTELGDYPLAAADADTWHGQERDGRWTRAHSTFALDTRGSRRSLTVAAVNHHPIPIDVAFTVGGASRSHRLPPHEPVEIHVESDDGQRLEIDCEPVSPKSYGAADARLLGIFVTRIAQRLPADACSPRGTAATSAVAAPRLPMAVAAPEATQPDTDGYDVALRRFAPQLLRDVYGGVLNRRPDHAGLRQHVEMLRNGGSLQTTFRSMLASDEFFELFEERSHFHSRGIEATLPPAAKRIAIYTNCQGNNLGRCIQAMTGTQPPAFRFVTAEDVLTPARGVEALRAVLPEHDVVLMQPLYADAMLPLLPELAEKLVLFPSISFPAFQPDQCYVRIQGTLDEVSGPLGPYHSAIAYHAWRNGLGEAQTAELFCDSVYRQLRYYDYWDSATEVMLEEGRRCDTPLESLLAEWRNRGCFMHSPNHPKLFVVADIARAVMRRLGLVPLPIDPVEVVWDNLADTSIWPVYPEIARHLGCAGSLVFKGNNPGLPSKAPIVSFGLEEFVAKSFEAYERDSRKHEIACNRAYTARYQAVIEQERAATGISPRGGIDAVPVAAARIHPYSALTPGHFWKHAIQNVPAAEVDPVGKPAFAIGRSTRVATAGSCFAQHISQRLRRHGFHHLQSELAPQALTPAEAQRHQYGVYSARYGNLYTPRQLLQLLERAYGEFEPSEPAWLRPDGRLADPFRPEIAPDGFADTDSLLAARATHLAAVRELFETAEVFVFTLGLTEAWRSRVDGAVFPLAPGVVAGEMDAGRHEWVNFGVSEVVGDLDAFMTRLVRINPAVKVLLTVSPVALAATYDDAHVLTATTYSKSVLRAAATETVRRHPGRCDYFPSYEIITGSFNRGAYFDADRRSVNVAGVDHVMRLFFRHYAPGGDEVKVDPELMQDALDNYRIVCEEERLADVQ